jgi:acyl-CoA reductase-like NAD-dependent aldehyde dehydrogenase
MPLKTVKNYINGRWAEAQNVSYLDIENPSTGKVIARTPLSTKEEANRAIEAAAEAYEGWSKTPVARRVKPLYKLVGLIEQNEEERRSSARWRIARLLAGCRCLRWATSFRDAPTVLTERYFDCR